MEEEKNVEQEQNNKSSKDKKAFGIINMALPVKTKVIIVLITLAVTLLFFIILCGAAYVAIGGLDEEEGPGVADGNIATAYSECTSIKINGVSGVVSLEDYVMGVVSAEAYNNESIEALKAQAIAARTYAIMRTNYCKNAIPNSSSAQNYNSNIKAPARQATEETAGIVLSYNGNMFMSQYDSFYKGRDFGCNGSTCSVTYKRTKS